MTLEELLIRIERGENLHTEFKERLIPADDLAASIVAFANTDGGEICFGVDDRGDIVGIDDLDQTSRAVDNVAYNNCQPPVTVIQETIQTDDQKTVLIVHIPKGQQRPYRTNRGVYYIRTSSGRRQASREELLRLFQAVESIYYDETAIITGGFADLDDNAIDELVSTAQNQGVDISTIAKERLLINWMLLREVRGMLHPTLAGVLFLARNPQQFVPYGYISALRIPGIDISIEPQDQKRIEGRIISQLEDTLRFLKIHLRQAHEIKELEPEVHFELPVEALREALVNSLAHRDYTISGPVRVIIFDNRVEIRTPGELPNTVTIEALKYGVHVLRNPTIYNMFLRLGLVTDAGSGIPRMIRLIRDSIGQEPIFRIEGNEFIVDIPRPKADR